MRHFLAIILFGTIGIMTVGMAHGDDAQWKKDGNAKATKLERCVEDTQVMRRDHMSFLMHQRDETMRRGVRTKQHSLVNCIDCHVNKDDQGKFIAVNSEGQFCQSCHAFTGVRMDCFQCHATKPRSGVRVQPAQTPGQRGAGR